MKNIWIALNSREVDSITLLLNIKVWMFKTGEKVT